MYLQGTQNSFPSSYSILLGPSDWWISWHCICIIDIYSEMAEMIDEMVAAVDDGDGEIDYDEFVKMIQKY